MTEEKSKKRRRLTRSLQRTSKRGWRRAYSPLSSMPFCGFDPVVLGATVRSLTPTQFKVPCDPEAFVFMGLRSARQRTAPESRLATSGPGPGVSVDPSRIVGLW